MTIVLNGESREVAGGTLSDVLSELGYGAVTVATAVNGAFVVAPRRASMTLSPGDAVEVLTPRQGG